MPKHTRTSTLPSNPNTISIVKANPFSDKRLPDGKKLFRRVHGLKLTLTPEGNSTLEFTIPYAACKINEVSIVWAPEGVQADFEVYDTPTGAISTVPNLKLNQFGFNVAVSKDHFKDVSAYDADLIQDMKLKVILKQGAGYTSAKEVGINIVLHEVVSV